MAIKQDADLRAISGTNFCAVDAGKFSQLDTYKLEVPALNRKVSGKLFISEFIGLTAMEISVNKLPAGAAIPFYHAHKQNEEAYLFTGGQGQMQVDGKTFDVQEGTLVRVSPNGMRVIRNNSQADLYYICIQAKDASLGAKTVEDGIRIGIASNMAGVIMIDVEEASRTDREAVLAATLLAYGEYAESTTPISWEGYRENIQKTILADGPSSILLVKDQGTVKGSVILCPPNSGRVANKFPEMRLLAVPPEFRNQGIAGALIDECERRAKVSGMLTLHTTKLMTTAKSMYERRGYERYPEIDFEPGPGFVVWGYCKKLL